VASGEFGENTTTRGIDLLALPVGALLCIGDDVVLTVNGLRNPSAAGTGAVPTGWRRGRWCRPGRVR